MVEEFHHAVDARPTDQGSWEYAGPGHGDAFAATPQNVAYFLAGTPSTSTSVVNLILKM